MRKRQKVGDSVADVSADLSQASPVLENTSPVLENSEKMEIQSSKLKEGKVERPPPIFVSKKGNYAKFSEFLTKRGVDHCSKRNFKQ